MVDIRQVSPQLAIKARDELSEVEKRVPEDIAALREWVLKQPHLLARTNDQFLLNFLRGSKYSLEKAKQKIDHYYTIRSLSPEVFLNKQIDDLTLKLARLGPFVPLPTPFKPDGPRLHITRYAGVNPNEFHLSELVKYQLRIMEIEMHEDDNLIIGGLINIIDMSSMSFGYLLQFDPVLVKKFGVFCDKAIPFRVKGMHLVNIPKEAMALLNIARGLMGKKIKERMMFHSSFETLYEHIPRKYLPVEYGGENGHIQDSIDEWEKRLLEHKQFFDEDSKYGANEKLRVGTKVTTESLFGLDGSFRKLEVD